MTVIPIDSNTKIHSKKIIRNLAHRKISCSNFDAYTFQNRSSLSYTFCSTHNSRIKSEVSAFILNLFQILRTNVSSFGLSGFSCWKSSLFQRWWWWCTSFVDANSRCSAGKTFGRCGQRLISIDFVLIRTLFLFMLIKVTKYSHHNILILQLDFISNKYI